MDNMQYEETLDAVEEPPRRPESQRRIVSGQRSELAADLVHEELDVVTDPARAVAAEVAQVLADLGRVHTGSGRHGVGGNDYWESGTLHPDRVLADLLTSAPRERFAQLRAPGDSPDLLAGMVL